MADPKQVLKDIGKQAPGVNQRAAKQQQAAQQIMNQQALGQAPGQGNIVRTAQQAAPQLMANQGMTGVAATQQTTKDLSQVGGMAMQQQRADAQDRKRRTRLGINEDLATQQSRQERSLSGEVTAQRKRLTQQEADSARMLQSVGIDQDNRLLNVSLEQRQHLAGLGRDIKEKILDSRLRFESDELGRKFTNERQMMDYTVSNAKTEQEFTLRTQKMQQIHRRKIAVLEHASQQLLETINRGWLSDQQKLDQDSREKLVQMKIKMDKQIQREKARSANNMLMAEGAGMIIGGIAGGIAGSALGPAGTVTGASAGATAGGGAGKLIYGATQ